MSRQFLETRGTMFEAMVSINLQEMFKDSRFVHSKELKTDIFANKTNTEIDLIMINPRGVVVIEAKNWTKLISGNSSDYRWVGISSNLKRMHVINPFHQNFSHIRLLRNAIRVQGVEPVDFINVVCVPDTTTIETDSNCIVNISYLGYHIEKELNKNNILIDVSEYEKLIRKAV